MISLFDPQIAVDLVICIIASISTTIAFISLLVLMGLGKAVLQLALQVYQLEKFSIIFITVFYIVGKEFRKKLVYKFRFDLKNCVF